MAATVFNTTVSNTDNDNGKYGSLLNAAEFAQAPGVLPPEMLTGTAEPLPTKVLLQNLPSIAMQGTLKTPGSPGSCEAQSFGYGLGSYTAARNPDGSTKWDASQAENQASAGYLYKIQLHQKRDSCPAGTLAIPYLDRLVRDGAPSVYDVPYFPVCCYLEDISIHPQFPNMTRFRLGSFATFSIQKDPAAAVVLIKKLLAAGCAVAFSGPVLKGYANPALSDGVLCATETIPGSGHGQLVVGYDDQIGPAGSPGAFLIQNSFGTQWPPAASGSKAGPGMLYWSYKTFETQSLAATAYPLETGPLTGTTMGLIGGPDGISRGYQWTSAGSKDVWLIVQLRFSEPILLKQVQITERMTGTEVTGQYGHMISNGYIYFQRSDGNQFYPEWGLYLTLEKLTGESAELNDELILAALPGSLPVSAVGSVTDTLGQPAQVVSRSE